MSVSLRKEEGETRLRDEGTTDKRFSLTKARANEAIFFPR